MKSRNMKPRRRYAAPTLGGERSVVKPQGAKKRSRMTVGRDRAIARIEKGTHKA